MAKQKTNAVEKEQVVETGVDATNTNQNEAPAKEARITSRSIAKQIFDQFLPQRGIYHGHTAFALPLEGDNAVVKFNIADEATHENGLFESYTHFRQSVRDLIQNATGCSDASARTMFIHCKNVAIETCRAEGNITIQVNGNDMVLDEAALSLVRDMKPKKEKAPKEEKVEDNSPENEDNRWLVINKETEEIVATYPSKAKGKAALEDGQAVKDRTKWTPTPAEEADAEVTEQASDEPSAEDVEAIAGEDAQEA